MVPAFSSDHQVVAAIWQHIERLLSNGGDATDASIRELTGALPALDSVSNPDLPGLAQLHLSSAGQLMATARLLVPAAFKQDSPTELDLQAICALTGSAESMVSTLIELQLFHLTRAKSITTQMRLRIAQRHQAQQQQQQCDVTCSDGSSCFCCDEKLVQSLE